MTSRPARRHRGAALLALLAVIMLGGVWFLLYVVQPANRIVQEREHNARLLLEAKQAILGWVVQNAVTDNNPGRLPCPESLASFTVPPGGNEGVMPGSCAGASAAVGRLPWKSLGIDRPVDVTGEVLWYVVGPGWKMPNGTTDALGINSNSAGTLTVDGQANAAVAAIIAPGRRLATAPLASQTAQGCAAQTQTRGTFPPADSSGYLECANIAGATLRTGVVDNGSNEAFNDQVVLITAADVIEAIEPVIAARLQRDVVPQLQSSYVNTSWGGTATEPFFPFAVSYPAGPPLDAAASDFKGTLATAEGLLPMTASTCNTLTTGRCDPNFVTWNTATISASQTASTGVLTAFTTNCAASTASQIQCDINFTMVACLLFCSASVDIRVQATANNIGRALRNQDASAGSGLTSTAVTTGPLLASGNAVATYTGTMPANNTLLGFCGTLLSLLCSGTTTVRIPPGVFAERLVNPATSENWYWFTANNWHQVTYYAVSQANVPGGARDCTGAGNNCLGVASDIGTSLTSKRAILALAGRSVKDTSGTARALDDFLDTAVNVDFNSTFEQKRISRAGITGIAPRGAFNDRFVAITP